jgi:thiol-disulfide isomerase/thioredoxin
MKFLLSIFSAAALLSLLHSPSYAADEPAGPTAESKAVAVGQSAPEWKELDGVDGKKHSSADIKDAKAVVVVFTCNHCPVAQAYEDRIVALANDYKDKGVELVAINVNNMEEDKLPAMKERAEAKGYEFAYLYDPSQGIGRAFGATVTPHAFLLDGEKSLVYAGAIDDNMEADKVEKHHLRDAIDAVLAGSKPETDSTKPMGCGIKYE